MISVTRIVCSPRWSRRAVDIQSCHITETYRKHRTAPAVGRTCRSSRNGSLRNRRDLSRIIINEIHGHQSRGLRGSMQRLVKSWDRVKFPGNLGYFYLFMCFISLFDGKSSFFRLSERFLRRFQLEIRGLQDPSKPDFKLARCFITVIST